MIPKEIIEGNELIAEFMGAVKIKDTSVLDDDSSITYLRFPEKLLGYNIYAFEDLSFRYSFDWIAPVYWKIGKTREFYKYEECEYLSNLTPLLHPIENFWKAAISFIKWYNENIENGN